MALCENLNDCKWHFKHFKHLLVKGKSKKIEVSSKKAAMSNKEMLRFVECLDMYHDNS